MKEKMDAKVRIDLFICYYFLQKFFRCGVVFVSYFSIFLTLVPIFRNNLMDAKGDSGGPLLKKGDTNNSRDDIQVGKLVFI